MKLFGLFGPFELIIILAVVLIIFGPKLLPKLGSAFGKTAKSLRDGVENGIDEAQVEEVEEQPKKKVVKKVVVTTDTSKKTE